MNAGAGKTRIAATVTGVYAIAAMMARWSAFVIRP